MGIKKLSLPLRERGLKLVSARLKPEGEVVAPLAGAWIEIPVEIVDLLKTGGRSPCGSVD